MIERQMINILKDYKIKKNVVTLVTQVLVDKLDSAFQNPTKPVGAFYLKEESDLLASCLLYTSDAADERSSVDLGGRRIIKKKILHTHSANRRDTHKNLKGRCYAVKT